MLAISSETLHSGADEIEIRSLFLNLKDKGNPALRNKIVLGDLDAESIVTMSKEVSHAIHLWVPLTETDH